MRSFKVPNDVDGNCQARTHGRHWHVFTMTLIRKTRVAESLGDQHTQNTALSVRHQQIHSHYFYVQKLTVSEVSAQELCESGGGHPGLLVTNSSYGLCGHKATLNLSMRHWRTNSRAYPVNVPGLDERRQEVQHEETKALHTALQESVKDFQEPLTLQAHSS